jgi:hypothetical protein
MNVALHQRVDLAEFLAWDERQELRCEFDGFDVRAIAGVTRAHAVIQAIPEIDVGLPLAELYEELGRSQAQSAETV